MSPSMNLQCIGINHRTAPLNIREKMWFPDDEARLLISGFGREGIEESVLISTCNRTELYFVPPNDVACADRMIERLITQKNAGGSVTKEHFFTLRSFHAAKHLFALAAGVDSMVLGDVQVLHQIKNSFALAREVGSAGKLLNRLFNTAFHVGKRVRAETEVGEGAISVGYAAAELASKIFRDISERSALLIGAGETGELTAKHLRASGLGRLFVANRTRSRADALAHQLNATAVDFEHLAEYLATVDIVVSSIQAPSYILRADDLQQQMKNRGNGPLFIIDLGVPRNIDPLAGKVHNIFLHDVDALNGVVDANLERRRASLPAVNRIVLKELLEFKSWHASLDVAPTIRALRDRFEHIRLTEVEKHSHRFRGEMEEEIAVMTKQIVNKILHTPMVRLRTAQATQEQEELRLLRSLFGLDT